jgi:hypothetical protein
MIVTLRPVAPKSAEVCLNVLPLKPANYLAGGLR